MIARLDLWILQHIYQAIVDFSQRKPAWWAENCSYACGVFGMIGLMRHGSTDGYGFWVCFGIIFTMFGTFMAVFCTRSQVLFVPIGRMYTARYFWLVLAFIGLFTRAIVDLTLDRVILTISDFGYMSFLYFAACDPPKPRTRLNFAGGAA